MDGAKDRLKNARIAAGFETAKEAAEHFKWRVSTYNGHENGQNGFKRMAAEYARAFNVSAWFLMYGEGPAPVKSREESPAQTAPAPPGELLDPVRTAHVIAAILRRVQTDMSPEDADLWAQVVIERARQSPSPENEPLDRIQTQLLTQFGARKLSRP